MRIRRSIYLYLLIASIPSQLFSAPLNTKTLQKVRTNLFKSTSMKGRIETARDHRWSLHFTPPGKPDTLHIVAIRIEFNNGQKDVSSLTTGNGLFGMRGGGDPTEFNYYTSGAYKYDNLPHDSAYFAHQLESVKAYYRKVSRGKLILEYTIYPSASGQIGYAVPHPMTTYSPGGKRKKEGWDEYYYRKTKGLMRFVKDAIEHAGKDPSSSPFASLSVDNDGFIIDQRGRRTVFLIFHAGSSYLTDGGTEGALGQDTPSDMIDAFITPEFFDIFKDSLDLKQTGVLVNGKDNSLLIDEVMMCSETSNQDSLNWGIQGILVNQIARQTGIPDLYSSSTPGVGAFCIMDVPGYSAGRGFIPPYPSAWVRAFMGWDKVINASLGVPGNYPVTAITSVLDRDPPGSPIANDTTILLVPINDHEYYLIENRQRNLSGRKGLFDYDTTENDDGKDEIHIGPFPFNLNVDSNVVAVSTGPSRVIQQVRNNDISIPASGVLVWHVDEEVIRNRFTYNMVNFDSLYKAISLVEADGINDLGYSFEGLYNQVLLDYGGAEDIFPHRSITNEKTTTVSSLGPYTKPSTKSKEGGHTYLSIDIASTSTPVGEEVYNINGKRVINFSDSVFSVRVDWDYLTRSWPKRIAPERMFDPVFCDLNKEQPGKELVLMSRSGRVYAWDALPSSDTTDGYGRRVLTVNRIDLRGDTLKDIDTLVCLDSIGNPAGMPSAIGNKVFIPLTDRKIAVLNQLSHVTGAQWDTIHLNTGLSSYICNYSDSSWAVGGRNGTVVFGNGSTPTSTLQLPSDNPVCAVAAIRERPSTVVAIQTDGVLSLCSKDATAPQMNVTIEKGVGPYTLVTGDLDHDNTSEIVVCDSRQGLWVYKQSDNSFTIAQGWARDPNDWANYYHPGDSLPSDRSKLQKNGSPPTLADIDKDGYLDIIVGGTNGLYAFNYKSVLIDGWPSYLDNRYWYQRGSVVAAPIVLTDDKRNPLVVFSSPTGENVTYRVVKLESADMHNGVVRFRADDGTLDSIWDLSKDFIDSLVTEYDSIIAPYFIPGGFIDAVTANGKRPVIDPHPGPNFLQSHWPLSTGAPMVTSPMAGYMDENTKPDLIAVSSKGWVYRWELDKRILPDSLFWPMTGYDPGRSFAYGGNQLEMFVTEKEPLQFYSYPNPTRGKSVAFRYKFSGEAKNVKLTIYTFTGYRVYPPKNSGMGVQLVGSYPGWNEVTIPLTDFGPAVYRCRLEATIKGKKYVKYWKMAVAK